MATYQKVDRNIPSKERTTVITAVEAGDQIDLIDVLGRPARGIKLVTAATSDTITYKLNNLFRTTKFEETHADTTVKIWLSTDQYPTFSSTGATEYETQTDLKVSSIEIMSLTGPANITIVVW